MGYETRQVEEWESLYDALTNLLANYGKEDAFGNGDYFVVSDNYGTPQQKVCVGKVSFITRPLALDIQRLIRKYSLAWEVLLDFDPRDPRLNKEDFGITVRKADIEECWNAKRMSDTFGNEFRWQPSLAAS
jgi:hypothetical protein